MAIEAGQRLQHYRLIEKIGEGGMGLVWKAEDTRLQRHVALKFVPEGEARSPDSVDRHLREARAASALNHPNICSIHDIGECEGRRFIVMELLEGQGLDRRLATGALEIDTAVELGIQVAEALAAAHAKGIVHRDIKPANLFLAQGGAAKVLDFGLAKLAPNVGEKTPDDATRTRLDATTPGQVMGTVSYMSPEQALGKELGARSDVFSLGVVLYEAITGRRAFDGATSAAIFDAILNRAPTASARLNAEVPTELERIVNKCLEKDPTLRYQSAAGLAADLRRLRRDATTPAVTTRQPDRPAPRTGLLGIGAVVLLVLVVAGLWAFRNGDDADATNATGTGSTTISGLKIAVLPFVDAGRNPDQRYFSEGLLSEIVTELSRYDELAVMPCRAGPCEGAHPDPRRIGSEIGVRYVLQGTVQTSAERIRVNVQLSDAGDGHSIWANSFTAERSARDLFDLQDDLTQQVVNQIAGSYGALARAELPGARSKPPESLASHDCVFRAYDYLQVHTAETHLAARDCLERVVEVEPDYVDGLALLAYLYADQYHHRWNEPQGEYDSLARAVAVGERAVSLDDGNQLAHAYLGFAALMSGDAQRGIAEMRRAISLNPHNPIVMFLLANYLSYQGEFDTALPLARRALELTPHPPDFADFPLFVDHYIHGRYEQALVHSKGGVIANDTDFREPLLLAATLGQLGRVEEAQPALEEMLELWDLLAEKADFDGFDVATLRRELIERHAFSDAFTDKLIEGLIKAGLPEAQRALH